jgi:hypothetical protein
MRRLGYWKMWKTREGDVEESLKETRGYKEEDVKTWKRRSSGSLKMMLLTKVDVVVR